MKFNKTCFINFFCIQDNNCSSKYFLITINCCVENELEKCQKVIEMRIFITYSFAMIFSKIFSRSSSLNFSFPSWKMAYKSFFIFCSNILYRRNYCVWSIPNLFQQQIYIEIKQYLNLAVKFCS